MRVYVNGFDDTRIYVNGFNGRNPSSGTLQDLRHSLGPGRFINREHEGGRGR
jgi:hypothetical protein